MPPQTIPESARLKIGNSIRPSGERRLIQSTTQPRSGAGDRNSRSTRLPAAPPRTSPRLIAHAVDRSLAAVRTITTITIAATAVNTTVAPSAKENAAPGLRACTSQRKPPGSFTGGRCMSSATTSTLETRSSASTRTAVPTSTPVRRRAGAPAAGSPGDPGDPAGGPDRERWELTLPSSQASPTASAALLPLLARHAQGRARERLQARLHDRLVAALAPPVRPLVQPLHRALHLHQQVAAVVGDGQLLLPLEGLRAGVGLVVARAVAAGLLQPGQLGDRTVVVGAPLGDLPLQVTADLGELLGGPVGAGGHRHPVGDRGVRGSPAAGAAGSRRAGRPGGTPGGGLRARPRSPGTACRCLVRLGPRLRGRRRARLGNVTASGLGHLRGRRVLRHGRPHRLQSTASWPATRGPQASVMERSPSSQKLLAEEAPVITGITRRSRGYVRRDSPTTAIDAE